MADSTIALCVLVGVIAAFMWNRLPVSVVALATVVALWATDLLTVEEATAGFGDPVVIFIATLLVVGEAVDVTGITSWAGSKLLAIAGGSTATLLAAIMGLCAVLSTLISLNGAVAALIPMVVLIATRTGRLPSRLLMPMVYGGSAGSLLILTGSPVNIVVSDAARDNGAGEFGFFEFALVGVPILAATIGFAIAFAGRLLPERHPRATLRDLSAYASEMAEHYDLAGGFYRLRVREGSPLIGARPGGIDLSGFGDVTLIGLQASGSQPQPVRVDVGIDDVLVVAGPSAAISEMAIELKLAVSMKPLPGASTDELVNRQVSVAEVIVPPRSPLVGETVFPGMQRERDLVILAIRRQGRDCGTSNVDVAVGDTLLLFGGWDAIDTLVEDTDVILVDSPDLVRRQVPLGPKALETAVIVVVMVVLLAAGLVPPAIAGLLAVLALVVGRVMTVAHAYRSISWETVVLVAGLIPLSTAMRTSGLGELIAERMVDVVGTERPLLLMAAMFVLTCLLGLVLSNTATVLVAVPIAVAAATEGGVALAPMLMLLAVAASASLLTPVQTPGNMMIMSPAGYRFSDYSRFGFPLLVIWFAIALVLIPIFWPL